MYRNFSYRGVFLGKKIFIVSKQKNRQKIQKIDIYNIHKLYTKKNNISGINHINIYSSYSTFSTALKTFLLSNDLNRDEIRFW